MSPDQFRILCEAEGPHHESAADYLEDLKGARKLVARYLEKSPLRRSNWLSELTGGEVWLKLECLNPNGSFKVRGGLLAIHNKLNDFRQKNPTGTLKVCAASAGNHAQGVAYAARQMGCEAHIFLPKRTPMVKRMATEKLGAHIYLVGETLDEAFEASISFSREHNAEYIHPFNDYDIILGQSTCFQEVLEQLADHGHAPSALDTFVCAIGGGGLASGAGIAAKAMGSGRILGVEQEHFNSAHESFKREVHPKSTDGKVTLADGIAVKQIGNLCHRYMNQFVDQVTLVSDDDIVAAVLGLCEREHIASEGAGAAAVAALLKNPSLHAGKRTVVCVSGGNIDPQLLSRVIARGLGVTGRVLRLTAKVGDRPGQLKGLLQEIAQLDANVLEVYHDRTYSQVNVGDVEVELSLETRNFEHQYELVSRLEEAGYRPRIPHG